MKSKKTGGGHQAVPDPFELRALDYVHFGQAIERLRKHLGLSQGEFGAMLEGFSQTNIARYESGDSEPPLEFWRKVTRIFGLSVSWLITGEGDPYVGVQQKLGPRNERAAKFLRAIIQTFNERERYDLRVKRAMLEYLGCGELTQHDEMSRMYDPAYQEKGRTEREAGPDPMLELSAELDQTIEDVSRVEKGRGSRRPKRRKAKG